MPFAWLPPLMLMSSYEGDWERYSAALYAQFCADFKGQAQLMFRGKPVRLKRYPLDQDRESTFWHLISEGKVEAERNIDMRRCERVGWPKAIIDNQADANLHIWDEEVRGETRTHVWCKDDDYLFVLAVREAFVLPWTGFSITRDHERRKLERRWKDFS